MKYYLISATEEETTMMQRINYEGKKPVRFKFRCVSFFGLFSRVCEKTILVAWNWNPQSLSKGQQIILPK